MTTTIIVICSIFIAWKAFRIACLYAKYKNIREAWRISNRQIWLGMEEEQIIDSIGRPVDRDQSASSKRIREAWKYQRTGVNRYRVRLTIEDGILTALTVRDKEGQNSGSGCITILVLSALAIAVIWEINTRVPAPSSASMLTPQPQSRVWTHAASGQQVSATLVSWTDDTIILAQGAKNKEFPKSAFTEADIAYLEGFPHLKQRSAP